jgi:hypothetical protein
MTEVIEFSELAGAWLAKLTVMSLVPAIHSLGVQQTMSPIKPAVEKAQKT